VCMTRVTHYTQATLDNAPERRRSAQNSICMYYILYAIMCNRIQKEVHDAKTKDRPGYQAHVGSQEWHGFLYQTGS